MNSIQLNIEKIEYWCEDCNLKALEAEDHYVCIKCNEVRFKG